MPVTKMQKSFEDLTRILHNSFNRSLNRIIVSSDLAFAQFLILLTVTVSSSINGNEAEWRWVYWLVCFLLLSSVLFLRVLIRPLLCYFICRLHVRRIFRFLSFFAAIVIFSELWDGFQNLGFLGRLVQESLTDRILVLIIAVAVFMNTFKWDVFGNRQFPFVKLFFVGNILLAFAFGLAEFRAFQAIPDGLTGTILAILFIYVMTLRPLSRSHVGILMLFVVCLGSVTLAFRSDFLSVDVYHLAYFVDVIAGMQHGFTLLSTQPSQYGYLNLLLPSTIPLPPLSAFHIFQASLLIIALMISTSVCFVTRKSPRWAIYATLCAGTIFLADPGMIGPNAFPSSSVVRFFPVYILLALLAFEGRLLKDISIWLSCLVGVTFFWSIEAFFYILLPSLFWLFADFQNNNGDVNAFKLAWFLRLFGRLLNFFAPAIGVFVSIYCIIILVQGGNVHLSMIYQHAIGYAEGLGAMPIPKFNSYFSIFLAFSIFALGYRNRQVLNPQISACGGLFLSLGTYYVGRAVPHNITAMMPIFVIASFVIIGCQQSINRRTWAIKSVPLLFAICVVSSAIANSSKLVDGLGSAAFTVKVPPERSQSEFLEGDEFVFLPDNVPLAIVSTEKLKFLHDHNNLHSPTIPLPPMLLNDPLSTEQAKQILKRGYESGVTKYLVFDEQAPHSGSDTDFGSLLINTLNCKQVKKAEELSFYRCD